MVLEHLRTSAHVLYSFLYLSIKQTDADTESAIRVSAILMVMEIFRHARVICVDETVNKKAINDKLIVY